MTKAFFCVLLLFASVCTSRAQEVVEYNVPEPVTDCMQRQQVGDAYELSGRINPFYLRGDFDGDGRLDYAVLIKEKATGKRGICICLGNLAHLIGAGKSFRRSDGYDFLDFDFQTWRVDPRRTINQAPEEGPPPRLRGEGILVEWPERGSGLIYWNSRAFAYYALGG